MAADHSDDSDDTAPPFDASNAARRQARRARVHTAFSRLCDWCGGFQMFACLWLVASMLLLAILLLPANGMPSRSGESVYATGAILVSLLPFWVSFWTQVDQVRNVASNEQIHWRPLSDDVRDGRLVLIGWTEHHRPRVALARFSDGRWRDYLGASVAPLSQIDRCAPVFVAISKPSGCRR